MGGMEMKKKFWISFFISFVAFSVLFSIVGPYLLEKNSVVSIGEEDNEDIDDEEKVEKIEEKGEILFLFMGVDDMEGRGGIKAIKKMKEDENGYKKTGLRSDTMILCKFSYETGEITMLSIPRDTRVNIRGRSSKEKINHAHSYGGPLLSVKTVRDFLNVDLEYYVTVDYEAVREIVNAIGGVYLDVPQRMKYKDPAAKPPLVIDLQPGPQTLDGDKALQYLRFRSYPEGDIGRVKAQQYFLKEFIKQLLQAKNITKIPKMISTYFDYVDTNIPITAVLKVVPKLNDIDFENINIATVPGEGKYIGAESYYISYDEQTEELVEDMFEGFILE
jgi:LCP family protein required for cell wall assembly